MSKIKFTEIKDLMKHIKNHKKHLVVNKELKTNLKKIVNELIKKSARKEALEILFKSDKERIGEFLYYYYSDSGNVACLVLDYAKDELVKQKKMKQGKKGKDTFGMNLSF